MSLGQEQEIDLRCHAESGAFGVRRKELLKQATKFKSDLCFALIGRRKCTYQHRVSMSLRLRSLSNASIANGMESIAELIAAESIQTVWTH